MLHIDLIVIGGPHINPTVQFALRYGLQGEDAAMELAEQGVHSLATAPISKQN